MKKQKKKIPCQQGEESFTVVAEYIVTVWSAAYNMNLYMSLSSIGCVICFCTFILY